MKRRTDYTRRDFVKKATTGLAAVAGGMAIASCSKNSTTPEEINNTQKMPVGNGDAGTPNHYPHAGDLLPKRILGRSEMEVSMLAFGGGSQFMANDNGKWEPLLERALALGINYFDTSVDYNGSEERFSEILAPIRDKVYIISKFNGMKNDRRNVDVMKQELQTSLTRLKTDYLDVFMIHSVDNDDNLTDISKVYDEMVNLKAQGIIKNIGFSSMSSATKSRDILKKFDFDVCMLAINPTTYGNYEDIAMPEAIKKNTGVVAMKVMRNVVGKDGTTAEELMAWALDRDGVSGAVIGHHGMNILEQNSEIVMTYLPSRVPRQWGYLERRLKPYAGPHALCWAHPQYRDEYHRA